MRSPSLFLQLSFQSSKKALERLLAIPQFRAQIEKIPREPQDERKDVAGTDSKAWRKDATDQYLFGSYVFCK